MFATPLINTNGAEAPVIRAVDMLMCAAMVNRLIVVPLGPTLGIVVVAETILGGIVVPGIVVVHVISSPNAVAEIALPLPDAVSCIGSESVAVSGVDGYEG